MSNEKSVLGAKVERILDRTFSGAHNTPTSRKKPIDYSQAERIEVPIFGSLATFDGDQLTRLVIAAHDECVRVCVSPHSRLYLLLQFHPRAGREGRLFQRHPTMADAMGMAQRAEASTP